MLATATLLLLVPNVFLVQAEGQGLLSKALEPGQRPGESLNHPSVLTKDAGVYSLNSTGMESETGMRSPTMRKLARKLKPKDNPRPKPIAMFDKQHPKSIATLNKNTSQDIKIRKPSLKTAKVPKVKKNNLNMLRKKPEKVPSGNNSAAKPGKTPLKPIEKSGQKVQVTLTNQKSGNQHEDKARLTTTVKQQPTATSRTSLKKASTTKPRLPSSTIPSKGIFVQEVNIDHKTDEEWEPKEDMGIEHLILVQKK